MPGLAVSPELLRDRFIGSLLGTAIGDSLGAASWLPGLRALGRELATRYTDDTHMTIGLAESLIACRGLDKEHLLRTFALNWAEEPWRGYGPGPPRIFRAYLRGQNAHLVASSLYPGGSLGNGAAMRIAPLACFYYDAGPEELRRLAYEASGVTHTHPLGKEGAALQAYAIALAIRTPPGRLDPAAFLDELLAFVRYDIYRRKLEAAKRLLGQREDRRLVVRALGNSVEAFNSVPTAIYAFAATGSFEEAVRYAVSLGGDADTIGAMTGALAGAYYGREAIPARWLEEVEGRELLEQLAVKLWEIKVQGRQ